MSQMNIFISYSHNDQAFTIRPVTDLRAASSGAWFDVSGIDSGDIMQRIDEVLRRCEWLLARCGR
jgi:hypothetical protein